MEKGGKVDGVVEQVPGLPHHEHTKIGYFDGGDQEFKNVRHPSMDLKSETENRKLARHAHEEKGKRSQAAEVPA